MKYLFAFASVLCFATPVSAADLPQYDVKAYCKQVAEFAGGTSR